MYNATLKVGSTIVVYGSRPSVGASTLAAMTASYLAAHGDKTLLLSTDSDIPFDAVSLLSSDVVMNHMDELVVLENSNGLNSENLENYVVHITDMLGYIRGSSKLSLLTKDAGRTMTNLMDIACYEYRYVVVDIGYAQTPYVDAILRKADLILHVIGQDNKSVSSVATLYKNGGLVKDKLTMPFIADYLETASVSQSEIEKKLKVELFTLPHCDDIHNAASKRDIAGFIYKGTKQKQSMLGGLFKKKKKQEGPEDGEEVTEEKLELMEHFKAICELIMEALKPEEEGDK